MHCGTGGTVVIGWFLHGYADIYLFDWGGTVGAPLRGATLD